MEMCGNGYGIGTANIHLPCIPIRLCRPVVASGVLRGGCWYGGAGVCRSAVRGYGRQDERNVGVGFRLLRSVSLGA